MERGPTPLEPVIGSVVLDRNGVAWQRECNQWYPAMTTGLDGKEDYAGIGSLMWGLLNKLFAPLTVLAPAGGTTPVVEQEALPEPKIPWEGRSVSGYTIHVGFEGPSSAAKGSVRIMIGRGATRVTPGNARSMATALLKAARQVEILDKAAEGLDQ